MTTAHDEVRRFGPGLAAVLANHPGYEDRTRVAVLDGLGTTVGEDQSRSLAAALTICPDGTESCRGGHRWAAASAGPGRVAHADVVGLADPPGGNGHEVAAKVGGTVGRNVADLDRLVGPARR